MKQGPDDTLQTPLGQTLAGLPQEEPPAGLEARCLAALDAAEGAAPAAPPRHWELWRQLTAAAAVLMLLVGVGTLLTGRHDRSAAIYRSDTAGSAVSESEAFGPVTGTPSLPPPSAGAPTAPGAPAAAPARSVLGGARLEATQTPPAPSAATPAPQAREPRSAVGRYETRPVPAESRHRPADAAGGRLVRHTAAPAAPTPPEALDSTAPSPTAPWREQAEVRRKVTTRQMDLETPKVEPTYKQAVSIVEKAGGFVMEEELALRDRGRDEARLLARVPVAQFDGVVAQMRELGRVVLLTGSSVDRTEQYVAEGEQIRGLGAREEQLTARYEAETNRTRRARLLRELQALRAQLGEAKQGLRGLHHQTAWATLQLRILESKGLRYLVGQAAREALPLTFSLALIAVPLLVLALLIRRRT